MERAANKYRFERKYVISELSAHEVEHVVKRHPAMFSEIFHARFVNNIYFDSIGMDDFHDSVTGSLRRMKSRIRWYGDLFGEIENPVLELKIKHGLEGRKLSYPLQPFRLDKNFGSHTIKNHLLRSSVSESVRRRFEQLFPVLLNRYRRKYFQSIDRRFRITLDDDLYFYKVDNLGNTFVRSCRDEHHVILELKYDGEFDSVAQSAGNMLPFRLVRSSKYVQGIECLGYA